MKLMNSSNYNFDGNTNPEGMFRLQAAQPDEPHAVITDLDEYEYKADMVMIKQKAATREHRAARQSKGYGYSN